MWAAFLRVSNSVKRSIFPHRCAPRTPAAPPFRNPSAGEASEQAIPGGIPGRGRRGDALCVARGDLRQVSGLLRKPRLL